MEKINVDEMFRCFKCDYMVDEPHESECCGKLYCQTCVVELNFTQCKLCKKGVKFRKNLFAKKLLQKVELKCRHHCGNKFMYDDMKLHLYRCESRIFKCTIEFCPFVGRKFEIVPHMLENHKIHLLTMLENYEDFKDAIDNILKNPIDNRPPIRKISSSDLLQIPEVNYNFPRLRGLLDGDDRSDYLPDNIPNLYDIPSMNPNQSHDVGNTFEYPVDSLRIYSRARRREQENRRNSFSSFGGDNQNNQNNSNHNRDNINRRSLMNNAGNYYFSNSNNNNFLNNLNLETFNALNNFNNSENSLANFVNLGQIGNNNTNNFNNINSVNNISNNSQIRDSLNQSEENSQDIENDSFNS